MTILTTSTGLSDVLSFNFARLCKSFSVCNLRCTNISFYIELAKETVNDNFKMEFTHTCDNCLSCLCICMCLKCRILFCKLSKGLTKFTLSCFSLRLDSKLNNRLREFHRLKYYRMLLITDGITCSRYLKTYCCCNIS